MIEENRTKLAGYSALHYVSLIVSNKCYISDDNINGITIHAVEPQFYRRITMFYVVIQWSSRCRSSE